MSRLIVTFVLGLPACGQDPFSGDSDPSHLTGGSPSRGGAGGSGGGTVTGGAGGALTSDVGGAPTGGSGGEPTGGAGGGPVSEGVFPVIPGYTNSSVDVSPKRMLDLVIMIDNSPYMAMWQEKLQAQFPKLIAELVDPITTQLPDLHLAIISSDLGTGGAYPRDSTCGPNAANDYSNYGDIGHFLMPHAADCKVTNANAKFLVYENGKPVNYSGDISTVFTCLAGGVGTSGCGQEHQLQAFEWALIDLGASIGNQSQIEQFLRPLAQLGLVFLTDEDDCSAAVNDGMFGVSPGGVDLSGEASSLRCATRAHQCNGQKLTVSAPGYPTKGAFSASLSSCSARMDSCPNPTDITLPDGEKSTDTSNPALTCSPLKDVKLLADEIKSLKPLNPEKFLVAGIFGWPRGGQEELPYKIDLIPNPAYVPGSTVKEKVYTSWPICYEPKFLPKNPNDPTTGFGAAPGLREAAFIDQFGSNGLKYSICEPDYASVMSGIGSALAARMQDLCVQGKLVDTDLSAAGLQAECRVAYQTPVVDPMTNRVTKWELSHNSLARCPEGATPSSIDDDCWQIASDAQKCPGYGNYMNILRTQAHMEEGPLEAGTKAFVQCRSCPTSVDASVEGCD